MSRPYAAPERWRLERATTATDVYALGVIGYELLAGQRPFSGSFEALRQAHLFQTPPPLTGVPARLASIIEECLDKAPGARPSPGNLLARLSKAIEPPRSGGLAALQSAHQAEIQRRQESTRDALSAQSEAETRAALIGSARARLARISECLKQAIMDAAPSAAVSAVPGGGWKLRLGDTTMVFSGLAEGPASPWGSWNVKLAVPAFASVTVSIPSDRHGYAGRGHSLWFCDAAEEGRFAWFEAAFMIMPLVRKSSAEEPFALPPGDESGKALWRGTAEYQLAWPFVALEDAELDAFVDRWAEWFARGATGNLSRPNSMPERSGHGAWRRG